MRRYLTLDGQERLGAILSRAHGTVVSASTGKQKRIRVTSISIDPKLESEIMNLCFSDVEVAMLAFVLLLVY